MNKPVLLYLFQRMVDLDDNESRSRGVLVIGLGQMVCGVHNPNPTENVTL